MAHSVSSCGAAICPELGVTRTSWLANAPRRQARKQDAHQPQGISREWPFTGFPPMRISFGPGQPSERMARLACVVVPGHPHHVTQRPSSATVTMHFMPNRVHLILVPTDPDCLLLA